jgi:hypothetical protein
LDWPAACPSAVVLRLDYRVSGVSRQVQCARRVVLLNNWRFRHIPVAGGPCNSRVRGSFCGVLHLHACWARHNNTHTHTCAAVWWLRFALMHAYVRYGSSTSGLGGLSVSTHPHGHAWAPPPPCNAHVPPADGGAILFCETCCQHTFSSCPEQSSSNAPAAIGFAMSARQCLRRILMTTMFCLESVPGPS